MKNIYCSECGSKTITQLGDAGYFNNRTGKRVKEKIQFCPNPECYRHREQMEDYYCPIKIKTGEHEYCHGFFGFMNPHCSGCGRDNSYMG